MVSSFDESVSEIWDGLGLMGGLDLWRLGVQHGEIHSRLKCLGGVPVL